MTIVWMLSSFSYVCWAIESLYWHLSLFFCIVSWRLDLVWFAMPASRSSTRRISCVRTRSSSRASIASQVIRTFWRVKQHDNYCRLSIVCMLHARPSCGTAWTEWSLTATRSLLIVLGSASMSVVVSGCSAHWTVCLWVQRFWKGSKVSKRIGRLRMVWFVGMVCRGWVSWGIVRK